MRNLALLALVAAVAVGCSKKKELPDLRPLSPEEAAALPSVDAEGVKTLLAGHKGKVALLVIWSAAAKECDGLFQTLTGISEKVPVVTLCLDSVDDVRAKALPVVKEHGSRFENRVLSGRTTDVQPFLKPGWTWALPAVVVYDKKGKKVGEFYGPNAVDDAKGGFNALRRAPS